MDIKEEGRKKGSEERSDVKEGKKKKKEVKEGGKQERKQEGRILRKDERMLRKE